MDIRSVLHIVRTSGDMVYKSLTSYCFWYRTKSIDQVEQRIDHGTIKALLAKKKLLDWLFS